MTMSSGKAITILALAAAACGSASAAIPAVSFAVSTAGGSVGDSPSGTAVAGSPGQYQYFGTVFAPQSFVCSVELHAMDTSTSSRMVFGGLVTLVNSASTTKTFVFDMTASTVAQGTSSLIGGSVSGVLSAAAAGTATFATGGSATGWAGLVNGSSVRTMMTAAQTVTAQASGTAAIANQSFGLPIPSMPSSAMGSSVGTRLEFSLSAGARVDLTTVFVVQAVPAPGALGLLAIAAAAPRRRRA
jgi:hypothetical protein